MKKIFLLMVLSLATAFAGNYTLLPGTYIDLPTYGDGDVITIRGDVIISDEMVLNGGAEVRFEKGANLKFVGIPGAFSTLKAKGTSAKKVKFKLSRTSSIFIGERGAAEMENVVIDQGFYAVIIQKNDRVIMKNVLIQNSSTGLYIEDASPKLYNCKVATPFLMPFNIECRDNNFKMPYFYACHFERGNNPNFVYHGRVVISGVDSDKKIFMEGNYWNGQVPSIMVEKPAHINVFVDTYPILSTSAFDSSIISFSGGPGTRGSFNADFCFFSNTVYQVSGGDLAAAADATIKFGVDRDNLSSYNGGTSVAFDGSSSFIFESGSKLISRGTLSSRNVFKGYVESGVGRWRQIVAKAGSDIELTNTTIKNAVTGIDLSAAVFKQNKLILEQCSTGMRINNSTLPELTNFLIRDCSVGIESNNYGNKISSMELNANLTGILILSGNVEVNNNKIVAGAIGLDTRSAGIIRSNIFNGNKTMIQASSSTAIIEQNTFNGTADYTTGIRVEGTTRPTKLEKNKFLNCKFNIINNSNGRLTAENNWFGANPPDLNKFSGSASIDCEPWYKSVGGLSTMLPPEKVNVSVITPANLAKLTTAPDSFLFRTTDHSYYGNDHLSYRLMVDDESTFSLPLVLDEESHNGANFDKNYYKNNEQAQYDPQALFEAGKTYYWKVGAKDPWGTDTYIWSDIFKFTLIFPEIDVNVESSTYQASAGEQINFTIRFANNNAVGDATQVHLNHVLPEEVSSNGKIFFSSLPISVGSVKIKLYENLQGTVLLHEDNFIANGSVYNYQMPANIAPKVVRYEIILDRLNNGVGGSLAIGSYVR